MKDDFLAYYNDELAFLRASGDEFAKTNPKIAAQLRLHKNGSEDPHIARLIESFAFLAARIRRKIDDDLPELTDALLDILYPHYQLPIPSFSIIQFCVNPQVTEGYTISSHTQVESILSEGNDCQFLTCYDTTLYPIELTQVELIEKTSPAIPFFPSTKSALQLDLHCLQSKMSFSALNPQSLRFFINLATPYSFLLYELLFRNALGGFIVEDNKEPIPFSRENIKAIGFSEHEGLLPYPEQSNLCYRLLTEFFMFSEKFLFFDIQFEDNFFAKHEISSQIKIIICFNNTQPNLRPALTSSSLALHCTPLVNLFDVYAEPILIDHTQTSYPIIPNARRLNEIEIYNVKSINLTDRSGTPKVCVPLYNCGFQEENPQTTYWQLRRENRTEFSKKTGRLTDIFVSFVNSNQENDVTIAQPFLTCTNHQLPSQLIHGGNALKLQLTNDHVEGTIHLLRPFTPHYHLPISSGIRWQLISHLMLNTLSFSTPSNATQFLKEILHLYNFSQDKEYTLFINSIEKVETKPAIARSSLNYGNTVFSGTEVCITINENSPLLFLFSSVLEKFISAYCAINSFTQLTIYNTQQPGEKICWKPNIGSKPLL